MASPQKLLKALKILFHKRCNWNVHLNYYFFQLQGSHYNIPLRRIILGIEFLYKYAKWVKLLITDGYFMFSKKQSLEKRAQVEWPSLFNLEITWPCLKAKPFKKGLSMGNVQIIWVDICSIYAVWKRLI